MRYEIRNVPAARAATVIALALGLPYGIVVLVAYIFLGASVPPGSSVVQFVAGLFGPPLISSSIVMATTWISVGVACLVYNVVASKVGGIAIELRELNG